MGTHLVRYLDSQTEIEMDLLLLEIYSGKKMVIQTGTLMVIGKVSMSKVNWMGTHLVRYLDSQKVRWKVLIGVVNWKGMSMDSLMDL